VLADKPGNYSCTFTATVDRECPPQGHSVGPASTATPSNYAQVEIRYKSFILCPVIATPPNPLLYDYFKGDGRGFQYAGGTSRTNQAAQVTANPANTAGGLVGSPFGAFGATFGYDDDPTGSDVVPIPPYCMGIAPGAGPDGYSGVYSHGRSRAERKRAHVHVPAGGSTTPPTTSASADGPCGYNPCMTVGPAIDAHFTFEFRQPCVNGVLQPMEWRLTNACHDGFPWHELYLNGVEVYRFDACVGPGIPGWPPWRGPIPTACLMTGDLGRAAAGVPRALPVAGGPRAVVH